MNDDDYTDADDDYAEPSLWPVYLAVVILLYAIWKGLP